MSNRYILTKTGQKHDYKSLVDMFDGLDSDEIKQLVFILGLQGLVDDDGGIAALYGLDITSSHDKFLNPTVSQDITLEGRAYNYFIHSSGLATNWRWTRDSGDREADALWNREGQEIRIRDADLTTRIQEHSVKFIVSAEIAGETYTDEIEFSYNLTLSTVQIISEGQIFVGANPSNITMRAQLKGLFGAEYRWYLNDQLVNATSVYRLDNSAVTTGSVGNVRLEVVDTTGKVHMDYISVPKIQTGTQGEPGVQGPAGEDGSPRYTWIKYADDGVGTNMNEYPSYANGEPRPYIGLAENKETATESNDPADYKWSKYIGTDGIPGENGYMWVKYSQYPKGRDTAGRVRMHEDPFDEDAGQFGEWLPYMGLAYNKQDLQESMIPEDYIWAKIKGDDGHTGYVLDLSNEAHTIPTDSEGIPTGTTAFRGAETDVTLYYGNDPVPLKEYTLEVTASNTGVIFNVSQDIGGSSSSRNITITGLNTPNDTEFIDVTATSVLGILGKVRFSIAKSKGVASYSLLPSVNSIKVTPADGANPESINPRSISTKVLKNTGANIVEDTQAVVTYRYSYSSGDGTPIAPGSGIILSNSGNPAYIEFLLFHPQTGALLDRETVPFVRDGKNGANGQNGQPGSQGPQGPQGSQGVPGTKAPILRMVEWKFGGTYYNNPNYKDFIYYRPENLWYKLVDDVEMKYSETPPPQQSAFVQTQEVQGNIIAENANIGGWIMRNDMLFSQAGMVAENGIPKYSNIVLDGNAGRITFGNDKMYLKEDGITLNDSSKRPRIVINWDNADGIPILRFLREDGSIQWEAGKEGYVIIQTGTTQPTWRSDIRFLRIEGLDVEDFAEGSQAYADAVLFIRNRTNLVTNTNWGKPGHEGEPRGYYRFKNDIYNANGVTPKHELINRGDILENATVVLGYYETKTPVKANQVPSPYLLKNGWYLSEEFGDLPGTDVGYSYASNGSKAVFHVYLPFFKNGVEVRKVRVDIGDVIV